jgi:hypothetical protein
VNSDFSRARWQITVNDEMRQTIEKLKIAVKELEARVWVRY